MINGWFSREAATTFLQAFNRIFSMLRRSFIPVLSALPLILVAGCSDNLLGPISPAGAAPSYTAAWTETPDSVLVDFEAIPVFGGARFYLTGAGVRFPDWMRVIDPAVPSGGFYDYRLTPPTSGNHAVGLGYFYPERTDGDVVFFTPVAAVSLSVRAAGGEFIITCYDAAGAELGRQVAAGYQYPEPFPVRVQRLSISAEGISWCRLSVAGGILDDFSFKRTRTPKLQLECVGDLGVNRVTRGQELRCQVSASDSSNAQHSVTSIVVKEWWFTGLDSRGTAFRFPTANDSPETSLSWGGRMLISGTVSVAAKVASQPAETKSAQITVEARDWSSQVASYQIGRISREAFNNLAPPANQIPALPTAAHHLGSFAAGAEILGSGDGVLDYASDYGPNHGLAFYTRVPVALTLGIMVHPEMENQGPFYRRHPVRSSTRECERGDFPRFVAQILQHEGLPVNPESHSGVFLRKFQPRIGAAMEDIVVPDIMRDSMVAQAQTRVTAVVAQADRISDTEVDTNHAIPFGCSFQWRE